MKNIIILLLSITFLSACEKTEAVIPSISKHFELINKAELQICQKNYKAALKTYKIAFQHIDKPFGKDVFNAALVSGILKNKRELEQHLQMLVNNSDDLDYVKSTFVEKYISENNWQKIIANKKIAYDETLRQEFKEIHARDQLFRPMYDTHNDTINANRIINLNRIMELTKKTGFPSHYELGYSERFWGDGFHKIVLHHTAQRRSYDKTIQDLEPLLRYAVDFGRFDPEFAIFYLNYQNDLEKGHFEVYSTWQTVHHLLPDSLNNKIWLPNLHEHTRMLANEKRAEWYASSIDDIEIKTAFLHKYELPFVFTSVRRSGSQMPEHLTKEEALEQHNMTASYMKEYKY